ncbi:MAG: alkaline phosphatase family protein [Bacteroidetes bacterium]|nr:alkaline phosphatase family protein [Bacteroidota bacterium]
MNRILSSILLFLLFSSAVFSQTQLERPKLVVGLMLDQMRWDYLYRYYDFYSDKGGFKRLLKEGNTCENTLIHCAPSVTACGHSVVYTGSAPAITGITGNAWWDKDQNRTVYCTEDKNVATVGSNSSQGKMSPKNMLVTSIADELRLATNFKSKVIGIAIKDRGAILPAGHSANAAYWYDNSVGKWITSTFYMPTLPNWVTQFNDQKLPDQYYEKGWSLLFDSTIYAQSTSDKKTYEAKPFGDGFPYDLKKFIGKDYGKLNTTYFGNELTFEFAKAALENENLGQDAITDLLAVSFSSPDYIGHSFGPNSMEAEDAMLRFDLALGNFLSLLDQKIGKNQYTLFLTADHGAAHIPEFMQENRLPGGRVFTSKLMDRLNASLKKTYKINNIILSDDNYQYHLNLHKLDSAGIAVTEIADWLKKECANEPGIDRLFPITETNTIPLPSTIQKAINLSYHPRRSGEVQLILKPGYIDASGTSGTTHGLWNPYDTHIPLLWFGWGIQKGKTIRETSMSDIAPTLATLLRIQMPSGNIGSAISEVIK